MALRHRPQWAILLLSALLATAHAQSGVTQGQFSLDTGPASQCAPNLTLRFVDSVPRLSLGGEPCTTTEPIVFSNVNASQVPGGSLALSAIPVLAGAQLRSAATCGSRTLRNGTGVMYAKIESGFVDAFKPQLLAFLAADPQLAPFAPLLRDADLSPGTLFGLTTGCAYRRTGDAKAPSPSPGAPASPSSTPRGSTPEPDSVNLAACFPADATVQLGDGSGATRRLDALAVGDRVRTGPGGRSARVVLWTHADAGAMHRFVRIATQPALARPLLVSHGHFVYADGALRAAAEVRVGMRLTRAADGAAVRVVSVDETLARGLYNPQTEDGDVVVNGVVCSTYTTAVAPKAAHALLAPVRAAFRVVFGVVGSGER